MIPPSMATVDTDRQIRISTTLQCLLT